MITHQWLSATGRHLFQCNHRALCRILRQNVAIESRKLVRDPTLRDYANLGCPKTRVIRLRPRFELSCRSALKKYVNSGIKKIQTFSICRSTNEPKQLFCNSTKKGLLRRQKWKSIVGERESHLTAENRTSARSSTISLLVAVVDNISTNVKILLFFFIYFDCGHFLTSLNCKPMLNNSI